MKTRKWFVSILMAVITTVGLVGPALAYQPEIVNLDIHRHFEDFGVCDGYNVVADFDVTSAKILPFMIIMAQPSASITLSIMKEH